MSFLLNAQLLISTMIIPAVIVFISQILLCRFANKPISCMIPIIVITLCALALLLSVLIDGVSNIVEIYIILYGCEIISCGFVVDIVGWLIGLGWRGHNICKIHDNLDVENNKDNEIEK